MVFWKIQSWYLVSITQGGKEDLKSQKYQSNVSHLVLLLATYYTEDHLSCSLQEKLQLYKKTDLEKKLEAFKCVCQTVGLIQLMCMHLSLKCDLALNAQ